MTPEEIRSIRILKESSFPTLRRLGLAARFFPGYHNLRASFHRIEDIVLISFIVRGECCHALGTERFAERGPCLGITPQGGTHCLITDKGPIDVMNLYLDLNRVELPKFPGQLAEALQALFPLDPRLNNSLNRVLRVTLPPDSKAVGLAFNLRDELEAEAPGHEVAAFDYFTLFLLETCRAALAGGIAASPVSAPSCRRQLDRALEQLNQRYREPLTLDSLADLAGLAPTYLCRAFKKYTGRSVFAYLLERRLQAAMFRLRSSDDKIIAVAFDCGFNDLSFFNRAFKRLTGMSPGAWRARQRGKNAGP